MIRALLLYGLVFFAGLFFQGSVISSTLPQAILPDILVVLQVYISLKHRNVRGLFGVYLLGLLADMATGVYLGPNAAAAILIFATAGLLANRVYAERIFAMVFISFICSILKSITIASLLMYYTNYEFVLMPFVRLVLFEAFATAFCAPIVIRILQIASSVGRGSSVTSRRTSRSATAWGA